MRVIAGTVGGRQLRSVVGDAVRPTSDRVREALFNRLHSRGLLDGAAVLDLFAGTGALGIEALSRGAARVTFVDDDPRSVAVVEANVDTLGLGDRATVVRTDALTFLRRSPGAFDLALLDPPYEFDAWPDLMAALPVEVAAIETSNTFAGAEGWREISARRYGRTTVTLLERSR